MPQINPLRTLTSECDNLLPFNGTDGSMPRYGDLPPEANKHFPAHGWISAPRGVRLLRLPVLRLYQFGQPSYKHYIEEKLGGVWLQHRSPYRTLRQLAVCLRDLHRETRELLPLANALVGHRTEEHSNQDLQRHMEGMERSEILLIAAFVLLRRLADELINASRPFLFEHWSSAPAQMKVAVRWARERRLESVNPICKLDVLTDALLNHTSWLDHLRAVPGVRDILMHKPHLLQVSPIGSRGHGEESINWRAAAHLMMEPPQKNIDLFPALAVILDGACIFMERLCASVGLGDGYQQGDYLMLTGQDNDIVGFWPTIEGIRGEFPLMD